MCYHLKRQTSLNQGSGIFLKVVPRTLEYEIRILELSVNLPFFAPNPGSKTVLSAQKAGFNLYVHPDVYSSTPFEHCLEVSRSFYSIFFYYILNIYG